MPFTVFQGIGFFFFSLREFCRDQNKLTSEVVCLVDTADESELPSQAVTFLPGHQKNMCACIILMEDYAFSID